MKKPRAVGLIIDPETSCVLLMRRHAHGIDYSTLPGGKIEPGENPEEACIREVYEEMGLVVTLERKILELVNLGRVEHYFLVESYTGKLGLLGPEKDFQTQENSFDPQWVPIDRIDAVNLLPVSIRAVCRDCLQEKIQIRSRGKPKESPGQ